MKLLLNKSGLFFVPFLLLVFSACSSINTKPFQKSSELAEINSKGTLWVYYEPNNLWQSFVRTGVAIIYIDDIEVGKLGMGEHGLIVLQPKKTKISIKANDFIGIAAVLQPKVNFVVTLKSDTEQTLSFTYTDDTTITPVYDSKGYAGTWTFSDISPGISWRVRNGISPKVVKSERTFIFEQK